jgi:hypothetical protein
MATLRGRRIGAVVFGFATFVMLYLIMSAAEFEQLQAATGRFRSERRLAKGVIRMKARYKKARDEMTQQLIRDYGQKFYSEMFLMPEVVGSQSAAAISAGRSTFISLGGGRNAVKVDLGRNESVSLSWRRLVRNMMIKLVQVLDQDQSKRPTLPTSAQRVWHSEKQSRRPAVDSTVPTSWTEGHERLFRVSGHELQFEGPVTFVWVSDIFVEFAKAPRRSLMTHVLFVLGYGRAFVFSRARKFCDRIVYCSDATISPGFVFVRGYQSGRPELRHKRSAKWA